jgi:hypothetical protein
MKKLRQSQDKPQTTLRVQSRRARLVKLFAEGKTVREAQKIVNKEGHKASRALVGFDLQALAREAPKHVEEARAEAHGELNALKSFVLSKANMKDKETVDSLLSIHDRIARLLGLDAPTKSVTAKINADIDPASLIGYRKFVSVTCNMEPKTLEKVYVYAIKLNTPPVQILIGPPPTSELWEEK